jgi:hypothetical protein
LPQGHDFSRNLLIGPSGKLVYPRSKRARTAEIQDPVFEFPRTLLPSRLWGEYGQEEWPGNAPRGAIPGHDWWISARALAPSTAPCISPVAVTITWTALAAPLHTLSWLTARTLQTDFSAAALRTRSARPTATTGVHTILLARNRPDADAYFPGVLAPPIAAADGWPTSGTRRNRLGSVRRAEQPSGTQQRRTGQLEGPTP